MRKYPLAIFSNSNSRALSAAFRPNCNAKSGPIRECPKASPSAALLHCYPAYYLRSIPWNSR